MITMEEIELLPKKEKAKALLIISEYLVNTGDAELAERFRECAGMFDTSLVETDVTLTGFDVSNANSCE